VTWQSPAAICRFVTLYREVATDFVLAMTQPLAVCGRIIIESMYDCHRQSFRFQIRCALQHAPTIGNVTQNRKKGLPHKRQSPQIHTFSHIKHKDGLDSRRSALVVKRSLLIPHSKTADRPFTSFPLKSRFCAAAIVTQVFAVVNKVVCRNYDKIILILTLWLIIGQEYSIINGNGRRCSHADP